MGNHTQRGLCLSRFYPRSRADRGTSREKTVDIVLYCRDISSTRLMFFRNALWHYGGNNIDLVQFSCAISITRSKPYHRAEL